VWSSYSLLTAHKRIPDNPQLASLLPAGVSFRADLAGAGAEVTDEGRGLYSPGYTLRGTRPFHPDTGDKTHVSHDEPPRCAHFRSCGRACLTQK
jgi:hypothetical protein